MAKRRRLLKKKLGSYPAFTVLFSLTLALLVLGTLGLLLLHSQRLVSHFRESIELHCYLDHQIKEGELDHLRSTLSSKPYTLKRGGEAQLEYISQQEASKRFQEETGEDFTEVLDYSPIRGVMILHITEDFSSTPRLRKLKEEIEAIPGIYEVEVPEDLIQSVNEGVRYWSMILLGFALVLLITVVLLINNTIKLAMFSQRFLIRSMQLVGARPWFITKPFVQRATILGLLGGVGASALLGLLLNAAYNGIPALQEVSDIPGIVLVLGGLCVIGGLIGGLGTYRAVRRYLGLSLDELH